MDDTPGTHKMPSYPYLLGFGFPFSLLFPAAGRDAGTEGAACAGQDAVTKVGAGCAGRVSPPMVPPDTKPRSAGLTKEGALLLGVFEDPDTKLLLNCCITPVFNEFIAADLGAGTCEPDSAL
jgi:hypothetical protein